MDKYVQDDSNTRKILFIMGHSRGAGVANIVGKTYEDIGNAKTFTYTFAAPNTTDDVASKLNYSTIFNIMNLDDIVCQIPCTNMGYDKYGRDVLLSISTGKSIIGGNLTDSYASIMKDGPYIGNTPSEIEGFIALLKKNINKGTREQIYEIGENKVIWDFCVHDEDMLPLTKAEAEAKIENEIKPELAQRGLDKYCILKTQKIEGDDTYEIIRWYNPAFLLKDISNIILQQKKLPDELYDYSNNV